MINKTYCRILNTNINVTNMEQALSDVCDHIDELRGEYICISNVHTTVMSMRDKYYNTVQNSAAFAMPDGKPLSMVCRRRGFAQAGRVAGPDLMARILSISPEKGYRHYFYGSSEETISLLRKQIEETYPGINIVGMYSPPFRPLSPEEDAEIVHMINDAKPDFIWVALGAPKQEIWMYEHRGQLNGVCLGVGAAFDFIAGTIKRAPVWMQELCLEWLYRIFQDPKRLIKRYTSTNLTFLWKTGMENRRAKKLNRIRENIAKTGRKPRVVMIGHKRIPSREGGVEIVVDELASRLSRDDYYVEAYNRFQYHRDRARYADEYGRGDKKYYGDIRVRIIPTVRKSGFSAIIYTWLATIRAMFGRYDILHFHAEGPCAMLWLPRLLGKRIIVTIHGLDWQRAKWGGLATRVIKGGEVQAAKHADEIIVLSRNVEQYFWDTYGRYTNYIPNGVNRPECSPADVITKEYGLESGRYILFLARIVPEKGAHYLIEAFKQIDTDMKLVIAGGSGQADNYMDEIRDMVADDDRIIMTGFVRGRNLEELYSNAYIYVLPSDIEGMALSLLEAASYGKCCLVSDIPENTEVLEDCCVTFHQGDVADLKDKLEWLLGINNMSGPQVVQEIAARSSDFICNKYSWDDVYAQTVRLYGVKE